MKASFQICNVPRPNLVQNTVIFSIFEARDSVVNLHVALDRYSDQIKHLHSTLWRYIYTGGYMQETGLNNMHQYRGKKIRDYLFGDYEFECRMVGITGDQGKFLLYTVGPAMYGVLLLYLLLIANPRKTRISHILKTSPTDIHERALYTCIGRHPCLWCTIRGDEMKVP